MVIEGHPERREREKTERGRSAGLERGVEYILEVGIRRETADIPGREDLFVPRSKRIVKIYSGRIR